MTLPRPAAMCKGAASAAAGATTISAPGLTAAAPGPANLQTQTVIPGLAGNAVHSSGAVSRTEGRFSTCDHQAASRGRPLRQSSAAKRKSR